MENAESKRLKLSDLRLISAIAKHGQISVAARVLSLSQPSASRTLAEIEAMLGTAIFNRHPKGMSLTEIGRSLADRSDNMLAEMRDLSREIEELKHGKKGIARVGAVSGPAIGYVVPAIRRLKALAPLSEVHIDVSSSDVLVNELVQGNLDFVFGRLPKLYRPQDFELIPAKVEKIVLLVHEAHPLADKAGLQFHEISDYEWVIQPRGAPIRKVVEEAFHQSGIALPGNITNTTSLLVVMSMLAGTHAIAPVSQELADLLCSSQIDTNLVALDIAREIEVDPYYLTSARGRLLSPVTKQLKKLIIEEIDRDREVDGF